MLDVNCSIFWLFTFKTNVKHLKLTFKCQRGVLFWFFFLAHLHENNWMNFNKTWKEDGEWVEEEPISSHFNLKYSIKAHYWVPFYCSLELHYILVCKGQLKPDYTLCTGPSQSKYFIFKIVFAAGNGYTWRWNQEGGPAESYTLVQAPPQKMGNDDCRVADLESPKRTHRHMLLHIETSALIDRKPNPGHTASAIASELFRQRDYNYSWPSFQSLWL